MGGGRTPARDRARDGHRIESTATGTASPRQMGYRRQVIPVEAVAAAYAQWITPALPLYGNDHERADFAP
ncbi:hypothetical protein GA0070604_2871 [Micromonospora eburnea]|uniref:Uncharacterized protein n=1 Tax=Micromonospora eburnea TaxID=227316 RepID=A0A1C6UJ43_9ACTN|nr:hypothetical protein GA0070604_2871 [Micromonospora eburnea]